MKYIIFGVCFLFVTMCFLVRSDEVYASAYASIDPSFLVQHGIVGDGNINVSEIQSDGKILIGGDFEQFEGVVKRSLMRLNSNGLPDISFNNDFQFLGGEPDVYAIAFQSDGKILVGGRFSIGNESGEQIARYLIRVNANGTLDTTFNLEDEGIVNTIAVQDDGKIIVGGNFNRFGDATNLNGLVRLNSNGSADGSFAPSFPSYSTSKRNNIQSVLLQDDGKILVGGVVNVDNEDGERVGIVRLNSNGSLDTSFDIGTGLMMTNDPKLVGTGPSANKEPVQGFASVVKKQFDGKIIIGGSFTHYNGVQSLGLIRVNNDGSVDTVYNPSGLAKGAADLEILSDGSIVALRNNTVQHFKNDGTLDESFGSFSTGGGGAFSINAYDGDKIIVCGSFLPYKTVKTKGIFRLIYPTESEDDTGVSRGETFIAQTIGGSGSEAGYSVVRTQDNGYLVAGTTTDSFGISGGYVLKFKRSGTLDRSFCDGGSCILKIGTAASALQLSDGKYIVTGKTSNNRMFIAKLAQDGSYDPSFAEGGVRVLGDGTIWNGGNKVIQTSDGGILVLGSLTHQKYAPYLVKLAANGSLDTSFGDGGTRTLEGGISLVGGVVQSDDNGFVVVGSTRASYDYYNDIFIVKYTANGSLDASFGDGGMRAFGTGPGHEYGYGIAKSSDGGYVLAGSINNVDAYIVKITANGALDPNFGESGTRIIGGSGNDVARAIVHSSDGGYMIAGQTNSFGAGGNDMYFAKLNEDGDLVTGFGNGGTRTVGVNNHEAGELARDITLSADGGYVAVGTVAGLGAGGSDIYMVYLDSNGNMPNSCGHQSGSGGAVSSGGNIVSLNGMTVSSYSITSPLEGSWAIGSGAIANRQCTSQANFVDDEDDDATDTNQTITIPKPDLSFSGKLKNVVLSSHNKIYIKNDKMTFKGTFPEIVGGKVIITYKDGSDNEEEIAVVDQSGNWSKKISFDEDGSYKIKFAFYDKNGKKIGEKGSYKVKIDTEDPHIDTMPAKLTKRVGDRVWWKVTDNEEVDKYRYYIDGKKHKTDNAYFTVPAGIAKGAHTLEIRAYDKAGNKDVKTITLFVR